MEHLGDAGGLLPRKPPGLGKALELSRVAAGLTQTEVATLLGKSRQTLSAYEREGGGTMPTDDGIDELAALYRTTRSAILRLAAEFAGGSATDVADGTATAGKRASLPQRARVWIAEFVAALTRAGVTDEEIENYRALLTSREAQGFYHGGQSAREHYSDEDVLTELIAFAEAIVDQQRRRGRKIVLPPVPAEDGTT